MRELGESTLAYAQHQICRVIPLCRGPSSPPRLIQSTNKVGRLVVQNSLTPVLRDVSAVYRHEFRKIVHFMSGIGIDCTCVQQLRSSTFLPKIGCKHLKSLRLHRYEAHDHNSFGNDILSPVHRHEFRKNVPFGRGCLDEIHAYHLKDGSLWDIGYQLSMSTRPPFGVNLIHTYD